MPHLQQSASIEEAMTSIQLIFTLKWEKKCDKNIFIKSFKNLHSYSYFNCLYEMPTKQFPLTVSLTITEQSIFLHSAGF